MSSESKAHGKYKGNNVKIADKYSELTSGSLGSSELEVVFVQQQLCAEQLFELRCVPVVVGVGVGDEDVLDVEVLCPLFHGASDVEKPCIYHHIAVFAVQDIDGCAAVGKVGDIAALSVIIGDGDVSLFLFKFHCVLLFCSFLMILV